MSVNSLLNTYENPLIFCAPDAYLDEVIEQMIFHGRNAILVKDHGNLVRGILTDHDIMQAVHDSIQALRHLEGQFAQDWMSRKVIKTDVSSKLTDALKLMGKHKIRHLVVTEKDLAVGIVSIRDILAKIHDNDLLEINVLRDIALSSRGSVAA